jgi:hypothetical protein
LELLDNEVVTSLAAKGTFRRNNSEAALFLSLKEKDLISCDDKKLSQSSLGAAATLLELDCAIAVRKHNSLERRPHPKLESTDCTPVFFVRFSLLIFLWNRNFLLAWHVQYQHCSR